MIDLAAVLIVIGVSLFVAAPLFEAARRDRAAGPDLELARLEHERALAVAALRELEFDREMRKLSEEDCAELKSGLETRALRAMAAIEKLQKDRSLRDVPTGRRTAMRVARGEQRVSPKVSFCPLCGNRVQDSVNFCGECGGPLHPRKLSMTR